MERLSRLIRGSDIDFNKAGRYLASWPIVDQKLAKIITGRPFARAMLDDLPQKANSNPVLVEPSDAIDGRPLALRITFREE